MKKVLFVVLLLLTLASVAGACGGAPSEEEDAAPTATTAQTTSGDVAPTSTPVPDQTDQPAASTAPPATPTPVPDPDAVAARVNGEPITMAEFQSLLAQAEAYFVQQGVDPSSQEGQDTMAGVRVQVLEQLVDQKLIEQAAEEAGITVSDQQVQDTLQGIVDQMGGEDAFESALEENNLTREQLEDQLYTQLLSDAVFQEVVGPIANEAEQIHARHILVESEEEAQEVLDRLESGDDFAALAEEYSQDPSGQQSGGDLGWFPRGVMVSEFEEAAFQLEPGETSGVVETSFGFHIIEVLEKDDSREVPSQMQQSLQQRTFNQWLAEQREGATIERLIETP